MIAKKMMIHTLPSNIPIPASISSSQPQTPTKEKWLKQPGPLALHRESSSSSLEPCILGCHPLSMVSSIQTPTKLSTAVKEAGDKEKNEFYVNLGTAVRTIREDLPLLFTKDLNYDIYRDDIVFSDPFNMFSGIENYKLIFAALRFHGRVLFKEIWLEVYKIWQPSDNVILVRWTLHGIPRVPWEARGKFQGNSKYKLDRKGKIYEHTVDNLAFNFPKSIRPVSVLDMVAAGCPASPNMTFFVGNGELDLDSMGGSSWLRFYSSIWQTLDQESLGFNYSPADNYAVLLV